MIMKYSTTGLGEGMGRVPSECQMHISTRCGFHFSDVICQNLHPTNNLIRCFPPHASCSRATSRQKWDVMQPCCNRTCGCDEKMTDACHSKFWATRRGREPSQHPGCTAGTVRHRGGTAFWHRRSAPSSTVQHPKRTHEVWPTPPLALPPRPVLSTAASVHHACPAWVRRMPVSLHG